MSEKLSDTFDYSYQTFWDEHQTTQLYDVGHILRRRELNKRIPESTKNVLCVGSGHGEELLDVTKRTDPVKIVAIDISDIALKRCEQTLGAEIVEGDLTQMPFSEGQFDFVSAFEILEHVPDDKKGAEEIFRVLKPGGLLAASMPHWEMTQEWIETGHLRHYPREAYLKLFTDAGFEFHQNMNNYQRLRWFYHPVKRVCMRWNQVLNLLFRQKKEYVDRWVYRMIVSPIFLKLSHLEEDKLPSATGWGGLSNFALFRKPDTNYEFLN